MAEKLPKQLDLHIRLSIQDSRKLETLARELGDSYSTIFRNSLREYWITVTGSNDSPKIQDV